MPKGGERKQNYFGTLIDYLTKYNQILLVGADNVGSSHMQAIRKSLRKRAVLLMGKNTMIRKAIKGHLSTNPELEVIIPYIKGNVGFVFTNEDLKTIRDEISANKLPAPARVGAVSPCDVHIPAGGTTMDPSQTGFMQALNIATRISKGTIEIINPVHLIKEGEKVGSSEAALLQKLDIRPFAYGLQPVAVFKEGSMFKPSILDITDANIIEKFAFGVQRVAALSLQINIPSIAAVPHYFASAYKNVLAVAIATDYTFPRAEKIKNLLNDPEALAALAAAAAAPVAAAPAATTTAAPAAVVVKEEEPEEEEDMGFGLFD